MHFVEEQAVETAKTLLDQVGVVVPTYHAEPYWPAFRAGLEQQGIARDRILVIDSSSTDDTASLAREAGYRVMVIPQYEFGHGATRQMALERLPHASILVYLTQDAVLANADAISRLCEPFFDEQIGASYGRQLPRASANAIERHVRYFNYPASSCVRNFESRLECGLKAAFCSNSFAAYRRSALEEVGGFSPDAIVSEDLLAAARLLIAGWKVAYRADAEVVHSHEHSFVDEFRRYFDIGAQHAQMQWVLKTFGTASGEGMQFVMSEARYLMRHDPALLPSACVRTALKFVAYHLGRRQERLPVEWKRHLSAHPGAWSA